MSNVYQTRTIIPGDHPSLNGHFPQNPVVPGVVILERIAEALLSWEPEMKIIELPTVKFHQLLSPNQWIEIRLQKKGSGRYRFKCECAGRVIASGMFIDKKTTTAL